MKQAGYVVTQHARPVLVLHLWALLASVPLSIRVLSSLERTLSGRQRRVQVSDAGIAEPVRNLRRSSRIKLATSLVHCTWDVLGHKEGLGTVWVLSVVVAEPNTLSREVRSNRC